MLYSATKNETLFDLLHYTTSKSETQSFLNIVTLLLLKMKRNRGGILFLPIRYEAINDKEENINFRFERKRRPYFIGTDILSL